VYGTNDKVDQTVPYLPSLCLGAALQIRALEGRVAGLTCDIREAQRCARAHALAARQAELRTRSLHDALARANKVGVPHHTWPLCVLTSFDSICLQL
jgi:hypothetical protein